MARHAALDRRIGVRIPGGQFHFLKGRKFLLLLSNTYGLLFYFRFLSLKFTSAHSVYAGCSIYRPAGCVLLRTSGAAVIFNTLKPRLEGRIRWRT